MEPESPQARIRHESAELMARYPQVGVCRATFDEWQEGAESRYSLSLDIRWPQHQTLISGEAKASAAAAIDAAFSDARRRLENCA